MMWLRRLLLQWSTPIQKFMQRLHPPEPRTHYSLAVAIQKQLRDGDILLSREAWHFTNLFIPGFWSHAAIVGNHGTVIEAVAPRVQAVDFIDWVMRKHNWCVLRPMEGMGFPVAEQGQAAFNSALNLVGLPYDYGFDHTNRAFYCSELVYHCWALNSVWANRDFTKRPTMGMVTVVPDDFYRARAEGKLAIIHEHREY